VLALRRENLNLLYFIIQPRLANTKEYKVCILSNRFTGEVYEPFLCQNPHPKGKAFINPFDYSRIYKFAKRARTLYESKVSSLVSPILRIDIMITQSGRLVVNEFESLEAYIPAGVRGSQQKDIWDSKAEQLLEKFWFMQISNILNIESRKRKLND
jgi:hypothetical protein